MKIRKFRIINGTTADMIIGAVDITGDARFTLDAIVLPLTILAGEEYLGTANFDDTTVSGLHTAEVTVTTQDLAYSEKTKLNSLEPVTSYPESVAIFQGQSTTINKDVVL